MLPVIEQVPANTVEWMSQVNKTHRRKRKGNDKHVDKVSHTERTGTESKKPPLGMSFMRPVPRLPPSNSTPKSWKGTSSNYLPRILHTAKACQICTQSINCILCEKKELQWVMFQLKRIHIKRLSNIKYSSFQLSYFWESKGSVLCDLQVQTPILSA